MQAGRQAGRQATEAPRKDVQAKKRNEPASQTEVTYTTATANKRDSITGR